LAVTQEAEGKGVGTRLMQALECTAHEAGQTRLALEVFSDNTRARAFYDRHGFSLEIMRLVKKI
jgi:ribosomal protein S18 acetylase RimI-like enzyme